MTDFRQGEVPEGMVSWAGGDSAPADWDGGKVRMRGGRHLNVTHDAAMWDHDRSCRCEEFDIIAYTPSTPVQSAGEAFHETGVSLKVADGQDRKFAFRDGQYVNRVSGEPIPHDEPIMIFRARDRHSLEVLRGYLTMATDEKHRQAIRDRMAEFGAYARAHPERMKEPGITGDIRLNDTPPAPASGADEVCGDFCAVQAGRECDCGRKPTAFAARPAGEVERLREALAKVRKYLEDKSWDAFDSREDNLLAVIDAALNEGHQP